MNQEMYLNACNFSRAYQKFACANEGDLPENLDALLDSRILKQAGPGVYIGPPAGELENIPVYAGKPLEYLDAFELKFVGILEEFEVVDEKLIDRQSREGVIFVRPKRKNFEGFARKFTLRIHEACRE